MRVALMVTCLADVLFPDAGRATVRLLRRLGVEVDFPAGQTCCGQTTSTPATSTRPAPVRAFARGVRRRTTRSWCRRARARVRCATSTPVARRSGDAGLVEPWRGRPGPTS